ncbi:MAG: hypothetical protein OER04_16060, partial [Cyclobacteriaceae bacterium]|nr:hypothetical protein [Cyclobacteriaceae bacterium]
MKLLIILSLLLTINTLHSQDLYIKNVRIFDGNNERIIDGSAIKIKGRTIEWMGKQPAEDPDGYEVIDGLGYYLMPGMIDAHTHINTLEGAERALHSGVTTVRSASTKGYQDVSLGNLSRKGLIPGPDFVSAGIYVTPNLGETVLADPRLSSLIEGVHTEEMLRLLVKINADRGA